jgi:hypothetical protein
MIMIDDTLIKEDGLNAVISLKMKLNIRLANVANMPANNPDNTDFENSVCL